MGGLPGQIRQGWSATSAKTPTTAWLASAAAVTGADLVLVNRGAHEVGAVRRLQV
jgi:hypothetical protein